MCDFLAGLDEPLARVGQLRRLDSLLVEAERGGQIAKCLAAPVTDVGLANAGEFLEKLQHRRVIEGLAADPTAGGPGRNDNAGNAEPGADRQAMDVLARRALWRRRRDDVIEQAVVLVIVEYEDRLCPDFGVRRDGVDLAGDKRRASRGHV